MSGLPSVVQLGRAGLLRATSADSTASPTLCCPETQEIPEGEAFLLLEETSYPPLFSAAVPSFQENQSFPFCSACSGRVGLSHSLPNHPWKNMVGRPLSDFSSLMALEKGGQLGNPPFLLLQIFPTPNSLSCCFFSGHTVPS